MQLMLRLIANHIEDSSIDNLAKTVTGLLNVKPSIRTYAPIASHHRGGYCVYLECLDDEAEKREVAEFFIANGWLPCF